jgi:hypothetical protein
MTKAVPVTPALIAKMFRTQALIPPEAPAAAAVPGGTVVPWAVVPGAALSADEAIAQYPGLREWWSSTRRPAPAMSLL